MMKGFARAALVACSLAIGFATAQAGEALTTSDLRQLFPGRFHGVVHGVVEVTITAAQNGSLSGQMMGKSDTGRWRVRRGQLCIAWREWTEGKYVCSPVTHNGGWFHANSGGPIRFRKL